LGQKLFEFPRAGVPYTIQMTVGTDGMASVAFLDAAGVTLGARAGMPVGMGPFYVVLADRNGPTFAAWNSVQLTPLAPPVAVAPAAPPATPTFDYFQAQLSPYGHWIDAPGIGACWVPNDASDPGWRPYFNSGHWEYTDAGWFWQSDYPWGEIAFHYGRWVNDARTGFVWAWAPAYDWAPAWVCWRYAEADGAMGWAPLPWDARFEVGVGLTFHGGVALDVDFGLGFGAFVFVGRDHFWDHDYRGYAFPPDRARFFFEHSAIHNGYRMDHGRFVAEGMGRERMAAFTHREVAVRHAEDMRHAEERHNFDARRAEHPQLAARTPDHRAGETPSANRPGTPGASRPGASVPSKTPPAGSKGAPGSKSSSSEKKPENEK
jgi:hypothetical protein